VATAIEELQTIDPITNDDPTLEGIRDWVRETLGAKVTKITRQRRWRPVWRVDIEGVGVPDALLFKSDRPWPAHPYPLKYEYDILKVLQDNGILIPKLYGLCPYPEAIVMEWVQGGRDPGMVMEAEESRSVMTPDRWAASLSYMEALADMHRIAPAQFEAAGLVLPVGPEEIALNSVERFYAMCQDQHVVDPLMEFCALWLRRNVPGDLTNISFVTGDCGQFLSDGPVMTAIIDMEVGHLGDNHHDLACFRGRHPIEHMGDLPALYRHYEKALGRPVDFNKIAYQTIVFMSVGYYAPLFALANRGAGGDWVESAVQVAMIGRRCMEAMAEIVGIKLEPFDLPKPRVTPIEDMAIEKLADEIRRIPTTPMFEGWQRGIVASIADYLLNQQHYSYWSEQADLDESATILGYRPDNLVEADRALVDFIKAAGPEHDNALIVLLYRKMMRQCLIIAGGNKEHLVLCPMEPIL
jgi:aminoglycoside phosphotransferase (APT) family kinase protein